ncbi:MAG: DUF4179 domain-containing protein [Cellulosilyticaceae bacterium]
MRKIEDMMKKLPPELLEDVDLTEEELAAVDDLVAIENIEKLALRKARNISKSVQMETNETPPSIKRRKWKTKKIILVAAALLITGTVFAQPMQQFFEYYIGDDGVVPPSENIQVVGQSVTENGITMTIQEAYTTKEKVMLVLDFTKVNEETFDEADEVGYIRNHMNTIRPYGGASCTKYLSEDQKTLTYIVVDQSTSSQMLEGNAPYYLEVGNIVQRKDGSQIAPINLQKIYDETHSVVEIDQDKEWQDQLDTIYKAFKEQKPTQTVGQVLVPQIPEITLEGMVSIEGKSFFITKQPMDKKAYDSYGVSESGMGIYFTYTSTGMPLDDGTGHSYYSEEEQAEIRFRVCEPFDRDKIKNITSRAMYTKVDKVLEAEWKQEIMLKPDSREWVATIDKLIHTDMGTYYIEKVKLDWTGIILEGTQIDEPIQDSNYRNWPIRQLFIEQKDGTKFYAETQVHWVSYNNKIEIDYRPVTTTEILYNDRRPAFMDPEQVKKIELIISGGEHQIIKPKWKLEDTVVNEEREDRTRELWFDTYHDFQEGEDVALLDTLKVHNEAIDITLLYVSEEGNKPDVEKLFTDNFVERRELSVGAIYATKMLDEKGMTYEYVYNQKPEVKKYKSGVYRITYRYEPTIIPLENEWLGLWKESFPDLACVGLDYWEDDILEKE